MATWSVRTAPTTKSSTRCTRSPIKSRCSTSSYGTGREPTTACDPTSRSPTSPRWNLSPAESTISERQSVTNLLDEYISLRFRSTVYSHFNPVPQDRNKPARKERVGGVCRILGRWDFYPPEDSIHAWKPQETFGSTGIATGELTSHRSWT